MPRSRRAASKMPGHPRLAAGLAGLGCGAAPHTAPAASASGAARRAANAPTPTTFAGRRRAITAASASSQAAKRGARSARGSLSGVTVAPALVHEGERAVVPHEGAAEEPLRGSEALPRPAPEARAPLTSPRAVAKPSTGRRGCSRRGRSTLASIPSQSRTIAVSPKGIPFWAIPNGPGFMPTKRISRGPPAPVALQVEAVRGPRVVEGGVDVGDGYSEPERPGAPPEPLRDRDEVGHRPYSTASPSPSANPSARPDAFEHLGLAPGWARRAPGDNVDSPSPAHVRRCRLRP